MPNMTRVDRSQLNLVNPSAAAIDIGSTMHMAAVNPDSTDTPIRAFGTFTRDLHDLARWFKSCGVTSVAMESTVVYWIMSEAMANWCVTSAGQCTDRVLFVTITGSVAQILSGFHLVNPA